MLGIFHIAHICISYLLYNSYNDCKESLTVVNLEKINTGYAYIMISLFVQEFVNMFLVEGLTMLGGVGTFITASGLIYVIKERIEIEKENWIWK